MARLLPVIAILAAWLYAMVDCAMADRQAVRGGLPKAVWFLITVLPALGSALWFIFGRPRRGSPPKAGGSGGGRRPMAPDEDPDFLRGL
ncbi:PLD nuclease N-terminal domain-containing protein [Sinomonas terrae]|uniref:PLD nuclease N-terminal domain-containing protein n=1 Tax=Sinomonas terrae TaxID=2908838 RepID=A0ABS9TXG2_9MICC|nr:PLD nuclease N-terminal domain-containing protein [Sinomonas terrae]MCH6469114.1 PLD nuclease N-terminal domain-containing protein [Sinomonas terrae]